MKIDAHMSCSKVTEMMGAEATEAEAEAMVEFLMTGEWTDTDQISEAEWLGLCGLAAEGVARNVELDLSRHLDDSDLRALSLFDLSEFDDAEQFVECVRLGDPNLPDEDRSMAHLTDAVLTAYFEQFAK